MEDRPLYRVETLYDETAYAVLVRLMMKHLRRWPRRVILATGLASVFYSGYVLLTAKTLSPVALLFLFLGNATVVFGLLAPRFAVRLMTAGHKKGETPKNAYAFYPDELRIETASGERTYSYPFLRRALDTQGFLVLFFRDGQVFLVRHADMPAKAWQGLREFIN
ncbi:MAG TPA: YcxB family protein, partial [Clostridia bacterium]|nr:YcxB family protein [Clostridia bacterium]